jgi:vacuolar-type H+-ATPase subunit I/STV1
MFGDLGHGFLMTLVAAFLIYKEEALKNFKGGEVSCVLRWFLLRILSHTAFCGFILFAI